MHLKILVYGIFDKPKQEPWNSPPLGYSWEGFISGPYVIERKNGLSKFDIKEKTEKCNKLKPSHDHLCIVFL